MPDFRLLSGILSVSERTEMKGYTDMREERYTAEGRKRKRNRSRRRRRKRLGRLVKLLLMICLLAKGVSWLRDGNPLDRIRERKMEETLAWEGNPQELHYEKIETKEEAEAGLKELSKTDKRAAFILEHKEEYPRELLRLAAQNPEAMEFVRNYPEKKGSPSADTVGEVTKGTVPLLLQWDERWGYASYGSSLLAVSGCGPTCLSMVIAGLTGENTVTPDQVATYAQNSGYYTEHAGTAWALMNEGSAAFGICGRELALTEGAVNAALDAGNPIICSMRPGNFTTGGHFIVLAGRKDGKIEVRDPNSRIRSSMGWKYETLEPQIKNLWVFSKEL